MTMFVELPKLVESPTVSNVTCTQLDVVWAAWSSSTDVGTDTLQVASYTSVPRLCTLETLDRAHIPPVMRALPLPNVTLFWPIQLGLINQSNNQFVSDHKDPY